ncbi:Protein UPS1, mitochondrial [Acrodontium crateriforme]|uniref:Protein UPS1, mitochondrial n=1 Tax=Acrodontium crateriforme TaxID=150365 RepID=A0AAQ3M5S7_9PEZI|nr:Protein UPS1, mitochondrial [Acrodontium crateriforme]
MVKFYSSNYSYDYSFNAVSLAYFLRYPNPYSRHVASTDVISRTYDPVTQRLTTVRLHVKRSRLPPGVLKLISGSAVGANADGSTQSFILENSVVDMKEGWMETESRNLDWNNVLSVIERQRYSRPALANATAAEIEQFKATGTVAVSDNDRTDVAISVTLKSRIGEQIRKRRQRWGEHASAISVAGIHDEEPVKHGWFNTWTSGAIRASIEAISLQRTEKSQPKAQKGMSVVLDRLRTGGIQAVLEGMRQDREIAL